MNPAAVASDRAGTLADWRDLVRERFVALDVTGDRDFAGGRVATRTVGPLAASRVVSGPQRVCRTGGLIDRYGEDVVQVGLVRSGRIGLRQDGRSCELTPGRFVLYRASRPFEWAMAGDWTMDVFTWPRHTVAVDDAGLAALTARTLGDGASAEIARAALTQLGAVSAEPSDQEASLLASRLADLVLGAAAAAGTPERESAGDVALADVLAFIDLHLHDPDLTPESVARAFHVSVRSLHRMFAEQPRTPANWIRHRRLERARGELAAGDRPIAVVAARSCFADTSAFARAFRREYGVSPREYRGG